MVATLQSRKDALEAKIKKKNEELKQLCLQEAELTGVLPPEIPLEPGEPLPQLRRRVGTSFSFPQNLINNLKSGDEESLTALELECKVQTNIAEAALTLANDPNANKTVKRKHRLMYRQSQRRLMELETRLTLLRQGKPQNIKQQHAKKKPRPVSNSSENVNIIEDNFSKNFYNTHDSWPSRTMPGCSGDEVDNVQDLYMQRFGSLHRSRRSSVTSRSSSSQVVDEGSHEDVRTLQTSYNPFILPSQSQPNVQGILMNEGAAKHIHKRQVRRGTISGHWDSVSAGGTLLPSQTYPEHIHHPSLNRTQSLGNVESNTQIVNGEFWTQEYKPEEKKEKEWYETSLDSAPSPPIRTSSRLPPAVRLMYNMREAHIKEVNRQPQVMYLPNKTSIVNTVRTSRTQQLSDIDVGLANEIHDMTIRERSKSFSSDTKIPKQEFDHYKTSAQNIEQKRYQEYRPHVIKSPVQLGENQNEFWGNFPKGQQQTRESFSPNSSCNNDSVIIDIPEDMCDYFIPQKKTQDEMCYSSEDKPVVHGGKTPTQPYYHTNTEQQQQQTTGDSNTQHSIQQQTLPNHHPPHAITQSEVVFDTVVPFESPQNHTVIQAGKWQPYREVTKPFEMSDFYKYSTKFRQNKTSVPSTRCQTPNEFVRYSPTLLSPTHQKGIYQPLKPMTCQPVEYRELTKQNVVLHKPEISEPEIV